MSTEIVVLRIEPIRFNPAMNNLAKLQQTRGWPQRDVANQRNTTAVWGGRYERQAQRLDLPLLRRLAKIFDVTIGEIAGEPRINPDHYPVPVFQLRAAAGAGALAHESEPAGHLMFREQWLRRIANDIRRLFVLEVSGDSMWETLHDGD